MSPLRKEHIPYVHTGAILSEDLIEHRIAAGAKKIDLDERIFFLKGIYDLFTLA